MLPRSVGPPPCGAARPPRARARPGGCRPAPIRPPAVLRRPGPPSPRSPRDDAGVALGMQHMLRSHRNSENRLGSWSARGPRLVADHRLDPARREPRHCASTRGATCAASGPTTCSSPCACSRRRPGPRAPRPGSSPELRAEGGHGEMLRIQLTDPKQEATVDRRDAARADRRVPRGGRAHPAVSSAVRRWPRPPRPRPGPRGLPRRVNAGPARAALRQ